LFNGIGGTLAPAEDLSGRKVLDKKNVESLNIDYLSSGIYILKVELSNNDIITKKIFK